MTPVMMAAAVVLIWISRQVDTQAQIHTAAEAAAQAAALPRTATAAGTRAREIATEMLDREDLCEEVVIAVDLEGFGPGGQVSVEIGCLVSTSGLQSVTGNTSTLLSARATAGMDPFKQVEAQQVESRSREPMRGEL
jgi:hypothetical protein